MSFIAKAFTPPGAGGAPLGSAANPIPVAPTPTPPPPVPPAPTAPQAPAPPPQFTPSIAPGAAQKAAVTSTTMLGAAATAGQTAKKTLLGT